MNNKENGEIIFCKYFRHWRTRKIVRPKVANVIVIHLRRKRKR